MNKVIQDKKHMKGKVFWTYTTYQPANRGDANDNSMIEQKSEDERDDNPIYSYTGCG